MDWAPIVSRVREQNGLKQAAFAEILGVDQATVSRWERGRQVPSLAIRNKLTQMLAQVGSLRAAGALDGRFDHGGPKAAESLLATVYARAPIGLCFIDADMRYVMINDRLAAMNGLPVEAHLGRQIGEILGDDGKRRLEPFYRQVLDSGQPVIDMQTSVVPMGGTPAELRYYSFSLYPVFAGGLNPIGVSAVVDEITERKRAEMALRAAQDSLLKAEARFRTVLNVSPFACLFMRPLYDDGGGIVDFKFSFINRAALHIMGVAADELHHHSLVSLCPVHRVSHELFDRYVRVYETGVPHDIEFLFRADDTKAWFRNSAVRIDDELAVYFKDITSDRAVEGRLYPDSSDAFTVISEG